MRSNRLTRALIDHRNISSVSGEVAEIYERPKLFKLIGVLLGIRIAEIISPEHVKHFEFFETVCVNRGFRVAVFRERDEALSWLFE